MPKRHTHDVPKKLYVSDCRRKRRKGKGVLAATHPACYAAVHGFDVDDRRSVDGFDGTNPPKLGAFAIGLRTPHCSLLFLLGLHWSLSFSLCQVAFNDCVRPTILTFRVL